MIGLAPEAGVTDPSGPVKVALGTVWAPMSAVFRCRVGWWRVLFFSLLLPHLSCPPPSMSEPVVFNETASPASTAIAAGAVVESPTRRKGQLLSQVMSVLRWKFEKNDLG